MDANLLNDFLQFIVVTMSHVLNGYLTAFFVVTGVILNNFSIFIFLRCERSGTPAIQYYLVALTIWQTALLCNAFLLYSLPNLLFGQLVAKGTYVYIYPYVYTFANTTHTGSVWIVLTLTVDRYLALCQPLKHRAIGKRSRVKRLMLVVSLMATIFSIPRFFEVHVVQVCEQFNATAIECIPVIERTSLFENKFYWSFYHVLMAMLFVTLCPCLLLCALTARISLELRHAIAQRKRLCPPNIDIDRRKMRRSAYSRKEHKSNIMLVLVIAKFLISDILPTVVDLLEHTVGQHAFMRSRAASLLVDVSNFLLVLNCSSNFWVFIIWGKRFRRSCQQFLNSSHLGATIYKITQFGTDTDLTSMCGPSSITMHNTARVGSPEAKCYHRLHPANRHTECRTYESTSQHRPSSQQEGWDYEQSQILEVLEKERQLKA